MKKIFLCLNFLTCVFINAQTPIDVTQTFGEYTASPKSYTLCQLQPDGKLITYCSSGYYNGNPEKSLIRFEPDGKIDKTFNIGSGFTGAINATDGYLSSFKVQPDNKIIVAGEFTVFNGTPQIRLIRLNSNGSKDTSFNVGSGINITSNSDSNWGKIYLQPDGKILIGGSFTSYNGITQNNIDPASALIRLNSNGSKDTSFNIDTGFFAGTPSSNSCLFSSIAFQSDGKILVGGNFTSYRGITANRLIRLNSDGTIDTSFNIGIGFNTSVGDIELQADGKILVSGNFTTFNGVTQNRLIRLNSNGTKDTTFDIGNGFDNGINNLIFQPDGKIFVAGDFSTYNNTLQSRLIRLNSNGTIDESFNVGTGFPIANFQYLLLQLQSDNKLIAGGNFTKYNDNAQNGIVRINTDGTKDDTFLLGSLGFNSGDLTEVGSGIGPGVYNVCVQPDGRFLVGGEFTSFNGITENKLIRFMPNGKKDTSFNIRTPTITNLSLTGFNTGAVGPIVIQSDGKILVGGSFTKFNNQTQNRLIRLNSDGTKDLTFNIGTGFDFDVTEILIQPDNKILVAGFFSSFNGIPKNKLIRLNQDGSIDNSLINFTFTASNPRLALQANGKILYGDSSGALYRLNTDGTNDVFFNVGSGLNNGISKIIIQPDNKILVGGRFTTYNGISQSGLIRFNNDGTKDATFDFVSQAQTVYDMSLLSDGKIFVCGDYNYNGIVQRGLYRLNSDASFDNSFLLGDTSTASLAFPNFKPTRLAIKTDGTLLVAGKFRNYFNYASSGLVGIRGNAILSNQNFEIFNKNDISLFPNPVDNILNFLTSDSISVSQIIIYDLMGKQINNYNSIINNSIDINNLSKGIYLVKIITSNNDVITKKIIKN